MRQVLLISGPPGCGKTRWILSRLQDHQGRRGYLRLAGFADEGLQQARDGGIDLAFLQDQCPDLLDLANTNHNLPSPADELLALIELPQFHQPPMAGLMGMEPELIPELDALHLLPQCHLHFGRDLELPQQDTLDFRALESWSLNLSSCVWDPASLSSFWFELVNGAYGDVYRAKALLNLPDGRAFFCNWMISQEGSEFLPLQSVASPHERPQRLSRLVVQGMTLNPTGIEATITDCLLSDAVLELQQAPLRQLQHHSPVSP